MFEVLVCTSQEVSTRRSGHSVLWVKESCNEERVSWRRKRTCSGVIGLLSVSGYSAPYRSLFDSTVLKTLVLVYTSRVTPSFHPLPLVTVAV